MPWILSLVAALTLLEAGSVAAATLRIDEEGLLLGAQDVLVAGVLHDVEFVSGRCIDLFSFCNEAEDFLFQSESAADAAASALLEQVLVDGPLGNFDSDPARMAGCNPATVRCGARTPWRQNPQAVLYVDVIETINGYAVGEFGDRIESVTVRRDFDTYGRNVVYAVWTVVPEPGTALLLGFGLVGLAGCPRAGT